MMKRKNIEAVVKENGTIISAIECRIPPGLSPLATATAYPIAFPFVIACIAILKVPLFLFLF